MMDEALMRAHMDALRHECARAMYARLCAACEKREGGLAACDQDMIFDACYAEDVKQALREDIRSRGVVATVYNGRQKYAKENKSVTQLRAYTDAQRKLFGELRITPAKRGAPETEGDAFDAL